MYYCSNWTNNIEIAQFITPTTLVELYAYARCELFRAQQDVTVDPTGEIVNVGTLNDGYVACEEHDLECDYDDGPGPDWRLVLQDARGLNVCRETNHREGSNPVFNTMDELTAHRITAHVNNPTPIPRPPTHELYTDPSIIRRLRPTIDDWTNRGIEVYAVLYHPSRPDLGPPMHYSRPLTQERLADVQNQWPQYTILPWPIAPFSNTTHGTWLNT